VGIEAVAPLFESVPQGLAGEAIGSFEIQFNGRAELYVGSNRTVNGVKVHLPGNPRYFAWKIRLRLRSQRLDAV
jgi:hypothetical protein